METISKSNDGWRLQKSCASLFCTCRLTFFKLIYPKHWKEGPWNIDGDPSSQKCPYRDPFPKIGTLFPKVLQRHWISAKLALQSKMRAGVAHVERVHVYFPRINFEESSFNEANQTTGRHFFQFFMHQYSLKSHWQPWLCSWTRFTSRFSGPLSWVYTHQERLFRRKVSFCSCRIFRLFTGRKRKN